ncbi:MAG TPA: BON domain-containing protein [Burkholderiales bacterium]|nr:BON domain-containing protein [Burkholderiales bacterium]
MKNMFIAFLLGVILGAAGYWFMMQQPVQQAGERAKQQASEAGKAAAGAAKDARQAAAAKLEALQLQAKDISEELAQKGEVVRRKAREVGEAAVDAATDTRITTEVKRKLVADSELSSLSISVNTTNGRVTLSGTAASADLVGRAMLLAMETDGVREVVSTIQVKAAKAPPKSG